MRMFHWFVGGASSMKKKTLNFYLLAKNVKKLHRIFFAQKSETKKEASTAFSADRCNVARACDEKWKGWWKMFFNSWTTKFYSRRSKKNGFAECAGRYKIQIEGKAERRVSLLRRRRLLSDFNQNKRSGHIHRKYVQQKLTFCLSKMPKRSSIC